MKRSYSAVENTYNCFSWCFSDRSNCSHFFISSLSCVQSGEFAHRAARDKHSPASTMEQFFSIFGSTRLFHLFLLFFFLGRITSKLLILKRVMKFNHKNRTHTHAAALIMMLLSRLALPTKLISFFMIFLFARFFFCFEYEPKFLLHFFYSEFFSNTIHFLSSCLSHWSGDR